MSEHPYRERPMRRMRPRPRWTRLVAVDLLVLLGSGIWIGAHAGLGLALPVLLVMLSGQGLIAIVYERKLVTLRDELNDLALEPPPGLHNQMLTKRLHTLETELTELRSQLDKRAATRSLHDAIANVAASAVKGIYWNHSHEDSTFTETVTKVTNTTRIK